MKTQEESDLNIVRNLLNAVKGEPFDQSLVTEWLKTHPEAADALSNADYLSEQVNQIDPNRGKLESLRLKQRLKHNNQRRRRLRLIYGSAAAIVAGVLVLFNVHFSHYQPCAEQSMVANQCATQHPVLISSQGNQIDMSDYAIENKVFDVAENQAARDSAFSNVYIVPAGYTCKLKLQDGTQVHLNACSKLTFPSNFNDFIRRVELEGEAYFDVAHSRVPFVVNLNGADIQVHGTKFNLKGYDKSHVEAVLVEGSISVSFHNNCMMLSPNQLCSLNCQSGEMDKSKVNVTKYVSWTQGLFMFEKNTIKDVAAELSRWYGVEIEVDPHLESQSTISAICYHDSSLEDILGLLNESLNIKIEKKKGGYILK